MFDNNIILWMIVIAVINTVLSWLWMRIIVRGLMFEKMYFNKFKEKTLFKTSEAVLFRILLDRLRGKNNKYYLLSHVRLKDLFDIVEDKDWRETIDIWVRWHVDFLVVDFKTLEPKLAIELDWWNHKYPKQKRMDRFKDKVFKNYSNIILKRIKDNEINKNDETIKKVDELLSCLE